MSTETMETRKTKVGRSGSRIRQMALIGMLSAIAVVLMLFQLPLPFAPSFYQIDFSEVPVLIGTFAMGPLAGAIIEFIKILLHLALNGTVTAGVGETANFLIGLALILPAGLIYKRRPTRKSALLGMGLGVVMMTVVGCLLNAYVLLPTYAKAFGMPLAALVKMGSTLNKAITGLPTFVMLAVGPFNLLKGVLVSVIVLLLYKKISPVFKRSRE